MIKVIFKEYSEYYMYAIKWTLFERKNWNNIIYIDRYTQTYRHRHTQTKYTKFSARIYQEHITYRDYKEAQCVWSES